MITGSRDGGWGGNGGRVTEERKGIQEKKLEVILETDSQVRNIAQFHPDLRMISFFLKEKGKELE